MTIGNKSLFSITAITLFGVAALGACSTKSTTVAPVAEADFALQAAHALCDTIQPCCAQTSYPYDQAACVARMQQEVKEDVKPSPNTTYDPSAAGRCVAKVRELAAKCADPADGDDDAAEEDCKAIYVGTTKTGEACDKSAECAPSPEGRVRCVHYGDLGSPGSVQNRDGGTNPPPPVTGSQCTLYKKNAAKGDPCGPNNSKDGGKPPTIVGACEGRVKNATLYCDYKSLTCQPVIAVGQPCMDLTSGACAGGGSCTNGTCAAPGAEGAACDFEGCAPGLYCARSSSGDKIGGGKCAKEKKTGEACSSGSGSDYGACATGSCSEGKCSAGSFATAAACKGSMKSGKDDGSTEPVPTPVIDGGAGGSKPGASDGG